jgi:hypothetical protein
MTEIVLLAAVGKNATSLPVSSTANFPPVGTFNLQVENELYGVTAYSGNSVTVTPGSPTSAHLQGAVVSIVSTVGTSTGGGSISVTSVTSGSSFNITDTAGLSIYLVNKTVGSSTTAMLPATPNTNQAVVVIDGKLDAATNNITINGNGHNIIANGASASTAVINVNGGAYSLVWDNVNSVWGQYA